MGLRTVSAMATVPEYLPSSNTVTDAYNHAAANEVGVHGVLPWRVLNEHVISDKTARREVADAPANEPLPHPIFYPNDGPVRRSQNLLPVAEVVLCPSSATAVARELLVHSHKVQRKPLAEDIP